MTSTEASRHDVLDIPSSIRPCNGAIACLDHTFGHQEDRIVVIAEDPLDAKKGVEFPLVDAVCAVRKPYGDPLLECRMCLQYPGGGANRQYPSSISPAMCRQVKSSYRRPMI